ncbi:MAG: ATP-binding protein [Burkholderiales bacterium]
MRWLPNSLLARTIIVLLVAMIASQLVSLSLFRYYSREPRVQLAAIGFVNQLRTIRAALEVLPPEQHREFVQKLREEKSVRVFRMRDEEPMELAPDLPILRVAREKLKEEFGTDADLFVRTRPQKPDAPPIIITRLPVGQANFYVVFPRARIVEQDFTWAWLGWGVFGGLLALLGAALVMWRVNRPLKALASAARDLGQGKSPAPLDEIGPSEVRAVSAAFNQMRHDLQRLDRERATFLAGVSHDLRTPLSRLRLAVEMLPADQATRADIENDIEDINGVIGQFMDFARDESTEPMERVDVVRLVEDVVARAARGGATIQLHALKALVTTLRPMAIRRVVTNLIDNAIKHATTPIDVEVKELASPGAAPPRWVLSVLDRGPGIAPSEVERLKQPFMRLDSSRTGASGAGLGLAIVDRIVRMHGGNFDLLPREGGGTEARVTLPTL